MDILESNCVSSVYSGELLKDEGTAQNVPEIRQMTSFFCTIKTNTACSDLSSRLDSAAIASCESTRGLH